MANIYDNNSLTSPGSDDEQELSYEEYLAMQEKEYADQGDESSDEEPAVYDKSAEAEDDALESEGYIDPQLQDEQAQGLRSKHPFLGYALRQLEEERPELMRDAMVWLREWVYWFATTYRWDKKYIPECWFLHSEDVEYLWAAANAEMINGHKNDDASNAIFTQFHTQLPGLKHRLETSTHSKCVAKSEHVGLVDHRKDGRHPFDPRENEVEWQQFLNREHDEQKVSKPGQWRAVVNTSEEDLTSEYALVGPAAQVPDVVERPYVRYRGDGTPTVVVDFSVQDAQVVSWERLGDTGAWESIETSARNVADEKEDN